MANFIEFSGFNWLVKQSHTKVGPGPNLFSDEGISLLENELKLEVIQRDGNIYCSEIFLDKTLGYGKYIFQISSRIDLLKDDLVLGLFTWDNNHKQNHCEIDIEFSKWGNKKNMNSQFVVQPFTHKGNICRFDTKLNGDYTTHVIEWMPGAINFYSIHGHVGLTRNNNNIIQSWSYSGKDVPIPANEQVHINLWKTPGKTSQNKVGKISYAIINSFIFEPD